MASQTLITAAEKMYGSMADLPTGSVGIAELLTGPTVKAMGESLELQRMKTEALMATMPFGVNISKVPEELRGTVTKYLTDNKQLYVEAAKVVSSGIRPTDPRYLEAMETMNRIRGGFEALDTSLVNLAQNRDLSIQSLESISPGALIKDQTIHQKFANGEIYKELKLKNGNFYYKDGEKEINTNDYKQANQQVTGITESLDPLHTDAITAKRNAEPFNGGRYLGTIRTNLKKAGKNGRVDFAYSGMIGDDSGQTEFIDKYIEETHNVTRDSDFDKYEEYYELYKNEDFSAKTALGKKLETYLLKSIRGSYDNAKTTGTAAGNYLIGGREITPKTFERNYRSHVDALNDDVVTGGWREAPNGTQYKKDANGWVLVDGSGKEQPSNRGEIALNIGLEQGHGINFEITGSINVEQEVLEIKPAAITNDKYVQSESVEAFSKQTKTIYGNSFAVMEDKEAVGALNSAFGHLDLEFSFDDDNADYVIVKDLQSGESIGRIETDYFAHQSKKITASEKKLEEIIAEIQAKRNE